MGIAYSDIPQSLNPLIEASVAGGIMGAAGQLPPVGEYVRKNVAAIAVDELRKLPGEFTGESVDVLFANRMVDAFLAYHSSMTPQQALTASESVRFRLGVNLANDPTIRYLLTSRARPGGTTARPGASTKPARKTKTPRPPPPAINLGDYGVGIVPPGGSPPPPPPPPGGPGDFPGGGGGIPPGGGFTPPFPPSEPGGGSAPPYGPGDFPGDEISPGGGFTPPFPPPQNQPNFPGETEFDPYEESPQFGDSPYKDLPQPPVAPQVEPEPEPEPQPATTSRRKKSSAAPLIIGIAAVGALLILAKK